MWHTPPSVDILQRIIIIIIINAKNTVCCIRMINIKYQIYTAKPTERPKVVGHDICEFVYFHIIVFCLDFHRGKLYLRKWGRKWNENKGKGKEPGVMEPTANWSRFSRRRRDGGTTAALRTLYLFTLNESTNVRPRSWVEGWLILGGASLENKGSKPHLNRKLWLTVGAFIQGHRGGTAAYCDC